VTFARREFSRAVKFAIIRRATDERGRMHCEGCGQDVTGRKVEIDQPRHVRRQGEEVRND
jgi:hypothetical protein